MLISIPLLYLNYRSLVAEKIYQDFISIRTRSGQWRATRCKQLPLEVALTGRLYQQIPGGRTIRSIAMVFRAIVPYGSSLLDQMESLKPLSAILSGDDIVIRQK